MPRSKRSRLKGKQPARLPQKFTPQLLAHADGRYAVVKLLRRRLERLKKECGADSYQKELLCERAVFIALQLETLEAQASEGTPIEITVYTQMFNSLSGALSKLGLERNIKEVEDLRLYVEKNGKKKKQRA